MNEANWPFLNQLVSDKKLSYFDFSFAQFLLKPTLKENEEQACFLCHLSLAAKNGHLCIRVKDSQISPTVEELWQAEDKESSPLLSNSEISHLSDLILAGANTLPSSLISNITETIHPTTPLCYCEGRYYLHKFWIKEKALTDTFKHLLQLKPNIEFDPESATKEISTLLAENKILPKQAEALAAIIKQPLTIICGGPGTGKSYTAALSIKVIWNLLSPQQKEHYEIALAAPTGKAAANLQKNLGILAGNLLKHKPFKSKTLHSLLGIRQKRKNQNQSYLTADLLIIDESSMIDIDLMLSLLKKVKPGARLVLLGDPDQLPSVEAGTVFSDIVKSETSNPVLLDQCLRAELKEIVEFSKTIQEGDFEKALHYFKQSIEHREIAETFKKDLIDKCEPYFNVQTHDPLEMLEHFNRFRILSPLRQGPFGVQAINELFIHKQQKSAPIILVKNDPELELFNGETGVLIKKDFSKPYFEAGDLAYFPGDTPGTWKEIPAVLLPTFEYAYCLSVHKSQGSEYDHVLLLLPERSEIFGKQVLYTGVTRAKKKLELWGSLETLKKTMTGQTFRLSGIPQKLSPPPRILQQGQCHG